MLRFLVGVVYLFPYIPTLVTQMVYPCRDIYRSLVPKAQEFGLMPDLGMTSLSFLCLHTSESIDQIVA